MRVSLLLLLLVLTAASTASTTAARPPALLVLRAACSAPHAAAAFRAHTNRLTPTYHLLSYRETCGADWSASVTRAALAQVAAGGVVGVAGWPGAAACAALDAATLALRCAPPAQCALGVARAAVAARLATQLGWTRAVFPPTAPHSECAAALWHVERTLRAAGLTAHTPDLISDESQHSHSYVVIQCASRGAGGGTIATTRLARDADAVLVLHVDEISTPAPDTRPYDAFSNINLFLAKHIRNKETLNPNVVSSKDVSKNITQAQGPDRNLSGVSDAVNVDKMDSGLEHIRRPGIVNATTDKATVMVNDNQKRNRSEKLPSPRIVFDRVKRNLVLNRSTSLINLIGEIVSDANVFVLSHEQLHDDRPLLDIDYIVGVAQADVDRVTAAERSRKFWADISFNLYTKTRESDSVLNSKWKRIALVSTKSERSLDESKEWQTEVRLSNLSTALRARSESPENAGDEEAEWNASAAWAGACVALGGVAGVALGGRLAARRRRRARRQRDVVLAAADFTFPADERRCVGDGMETMLSCWLQQLHEFGGPELERPDLLKQQPAVPLRAPSAPSSTCSVNRLAQDRKTRYKGDAIHLKYLQCPGSLELKRKAIDVLLTMQNLRHENLNPFIGWVYEPRAALVFDWCGRGSLEDVLMADEIKLDWTFRLSLLTDLVKGMRYLHASPLRVHGRLSSRNCVVDSRWVLRLTDYGLPAFHRAQPLPLPHRSARELLWTAPELLRDPAAGARGSQPGDVFSFAIIMQEVIVRGEPYCMLALTPEEIVEKVKRPPPLIRPSVSMGAAPPEAVSVMRQCWSEAPDLRPDFHRLLDIFRHLHRGRKINIVDSMFEMLEKYSNNLEELIKERTEQLDMEKKKTEQLLNRMLPRSVAERLLLGSRVEPEEFEEVSIYFSDIVGFTALAARSTPVQVVDLLNDLYTTFDAAIEQYRVYKVETIGDAYMVVGGLPVRTHDHAEAVATMALHLLHLAGRFRVRHLPDTPLHLRIGLHTGPCCAGVVGLTMPRYCLFGDTVNTASRMESTGAAWRVQVSAATAERLAAAGTYRLRSRGLTMVKGKGPMHTYWLLGKDGFDKPLPTPPPLPTEEVLFEADGENDSEASSSGAASGDAPPAEQARDQPTPLHPGWQRSGAVSADSSPPAVRAPRLATAGSVERAGCGRYRWLGGAAGGGRALRRQWSLERGDVLATAAAAELGPAPPDTLALLATPAPRAPPPPRYRMRPDPPPDD